MKIRPLQDRIVVKRVESETKTKGGIIIPDTAKEKPLEGEVVAVGNGKVLQGRQGSPARREGRRQGAVRQVHRHRGQARRRGARAPPRGRRPRRDRVRRTELRQPNAGRPRGREDEHGCQADRLQPRRPRSHPHGREHARRRGQGHARPQGPQRRHREELGLARSSTKDGVTVAKEIELAGKFENMGAQMVREVASKTSDKAGDGTTTATVLAQAIYREGLKLVDAGHNPMELKRGIDAGGRGRSSSRARRLAKPTKDKDADRPGRHDQRQRRRRRSARSSPTRWRRSARKA